MKKRINIGIVNVDPYSENLGVGALAYSTLFILDLLSENLNYIFDLFIIMDSVPKRKDTFYIGGIQNRSTVCKTNQFTEC